MILLLAVIAAQVADVATWMAMPRYAEANFLVAGMHTEAAVLAKGALLVLVLALQPILRPKYRPVGELVAIVALAAGCLGAGSNLAVLTATGGNDAGRVRSDGGHVEWADVSDTSVERVDQGDARLASRKAVLSPRPRATSGRREGLRGRASWFDAAPGVAAAGPALRKALGPHWRHSVVLVTAGGRSVLVRLTDWCGCPHGRIIDLSDDAFRELAPLPVGVLTVRVDVPRLAPPATDSE